jgi:hypothetical protein
MVEIAQELQRADQSFTFAMLRPILDEFWNLLDGERAIENIWTILCFEFDVDIPDWLAIEVAGKLLATGQAVRVD